MINTCKFNIYDVIRGVMAKHFEWLEVPVRIGSVLTILAFFRVRYFNVCVSIATTMQAILYLMWAMESCPFIPAPSLTAMTSYFSNTRPMALDESFLRLWFFPISLDKHHNFEASKTFDR